jgi:DNA integrity scanning protein DisA with diadenylate cyclase activity
MKHLWSIVYAALRQKHGTMIVIIQEALSEAERLRHQSTTIKPIRLDPHFLLPLSSIDGAILIEPNATCHAIGVILDGIASEKGDPARGARYNSAIRYNDYLRARDQSCLIVVISEDGMVDLISSDES